MTPTGQLRTWQGRIPNPFKQNKVSPLRSVPGFETPECIRPDLMHCFNIGIGGDLAASGLMAACRMSIFGERSLEKCLDEAHDRFDTWCRLNHKTASIKSFEKKRFKVITFLDYLKHDFIWVVFQASYNSQSFSPPWSAPCLSQELRLSARNWQST